jgi:hypothetical protein
MERKRQSFIRIIFYLVEPKFRSLFELTSAISFESSLATLKDNLVSVAASKRQKNSLTLIKEKPFGGRVQE